MLRRLQGRTAIISGCSGGIGRCMALKFAREGANIVCADLSPGSKGSATHEVIASNGGQSLFVRTDVGDEESVKTLILKAVDRFGGIDILVNNAAIAPEASKPQPIYETPTDIFDATIRVNFRGVFLGMKYAGAQMMKQDPHPNGDRGWIVNIASVLGLVGKSGTVSYSGAKAAVVNMTRSAALDYAPHRIHVNVIAPGFTRTPMLEEQLRNPSIKAEIDRLHPFKGLGAPEDIANAALFLASDDASWISGVTLPVDGGYTAM